MILMQPKKVANLIIGSKKPDYVDSIGETKVSMSPEVEEDNSYIANFCSVHNYLTRAV